MAVDGLPASASAWLLHPQLAADTSPVCDLVLSRVLAMNAAEYPWLILVPRRAGVVEIFDLGDDARLLMTEIAMTSRALKEVTGCDKLNIAAIGNMVPQLHVHIVARRIGDPLWPKPVWGMAHPSGAAADFASFIDSIGRALANSG